LIEAHQIYKTSWVYDDTQKEVTVGINQIILPNPTDHDWKSLPMKCLPWNLECKGKKIS
jgi:hypothetical protein